MGGKDNDFYRSVVIWLATVYSDILEEQHRVEDLLKESIKWLDGVNKNMNAAYDNAKSEYMFRFGYLSGIMGLYLKVSRVDKTQKIYKEMKTEIKEVGLEKTTAMMFADFIFL